MNDDGDDWLEEKYKIIFETSWQNWLGFISVSRQKELQHCTLYSCHCTATLSLSLETQHDQKSQTPGREGLHHSVISVSSDWEVLHFPVLVS